MIGSPHGTYAFGFVVVVMSGDTIISVTLDEFQFQADNGNFTGVPNSHSSAAKYFGKGYAAGQILVSKKADSAGYSAVQKAKAGSTNSIAENYAYIEDYAVGKTIAQLERTVSMDADAVVDAVTGATLVGTKGYLNMIITAAKAAK
ncbi:MAG: hypothetical protein PQJ59_12735 [Spirochaetales bacterium]|nr:hypothetical protein [Spirochaetales bacterium]